MTNSTPSKTRRKAAGLSQEQLAAMAGLHRLTVTRIEAGGAHRVKLHDLRAIAKVLDCDWREIHGAGVPLLAETEEDLAEIMGGHEVKCACSTSDATAVLAEWLGRDPDDPAFRNYVGELHNALTAEAATA